MKRLLGDHRVVSVAVAAATFLGVAGGHLAAQSPSSEHKFEAGIQLAAPNLSQFEETDLGGGGRIAYLLNDLFALEGELNFYPGDLTDASSFSDGRTEALFGMTVGRSMEVVRIFGKARMGFVRFGAAPEPIACIAIFPPPLPCELAGGRMVTALDLGGGIELSPTPTTFLRLDVGDELLKYPGPVLDTEGEARADGFFSHNLRIAVGAGLRFRP